MSGQLLLDNSAWTRFGSPALPQARAEEVVAMAARRQLSVCLNFLLETGYSARNAADHLIRFRRLSALPYLAIDSQVEQRALEAQAELARTGHHRLPLSDLVIAALADRAGIGVLHYDKDYDIIRDKTSLNFKSVWLAERGTL